MNESIVAPAAAETQAGLGVEELRELFILCGRLLSFDAVRLKPRERQFALLLAGDSLALGRDWGRVGVSAPVKGRRQSGGWCVRLSDWRPSEIWEMMCAWRRAGWIAVDQAEGRFRLALDQLPGWADARRLLEVESRGQDVLPLTTPPDLHKEVARFSQAAAKVAKFPQHTSLGTPVPVPNVQTFNHLTSQRINVQRLNVGAGCENLASSGDRRGLAERVRSFVGETDWAAKEFWNRGLGWRGRIFVEEAGALESALNYCETSLATGETRLKKTRGAFLWDEFQRQRRVRTG